MSIQARP